MFFFHHPRKVTSNKEVAVQVVQNKDLRTPIDTQAPVIVVEGAAEKKFDFDKVGQPLIR